MVTAMLLTLYVAPVLLVFGVLTMLAEWLEGGE